MNLDEMRDKIDTIDEQLLNLFQQRMDTASEIAAFKQQHDLPT
jgi:chorismate mutase/prephenate dehydratase